MHVPVCSFVKRCRAFDSVLVGRSFKSVVVAVRAVVTIVMTLLFVYGFTALVYQYVPWSHWLLGVGKQAFRTLRVSWGIMGACHIGKCR